MTANEFVKWLGTELQSLFQKSTDLNQFQASQDLVKRAFTKLIDAQSTERKRILDAINASHQSGKIGDYKIPFDDRDKFDIIEATLATIEAYLED